MSNGETMMSIFKKLVTVAVLFGGLTASGGSWAQAIFHPEVPEYHFDTPTQGSPTRTHPRKIEPHAQAASIARAHGAVTRTHARQVVRREPVEIDPFHIDDCRSIFAQCGYPH
jgi:hypothetical protein